MQKLTGAMICKLIAEKKVDPETLTLHQRRAAMWHLYIETDNNRPSVIAEFLKIPDCNVRRELRRIEKEFQTMYLPEPGEVHKIVGRLAGRASILYDKAMKKGDYQLCWKIENELSEKLGRFGYAAYNGELIRVHTGDVIESGGKKIAQTQINNNAGRPPWLTEEDDRRISRILAEAKSRANFEQSGALVAGTQGDQGTDF